MTTIETTTTTTKAPLKIRKFTVSERWVEVSVKVISAHFDQMKAREAYSSDWHKKIINAYFIRLASIYRNHRENDACSERAPAKSFVEDTREFRTDGEIWGDMRGRRGMADFVLVLKEDYWQSMILLAASIGAKPEALVRAALADKIRLWMRDSANEPVKFSFPVPVSEIRDLCAYMANSKSPVGKHCPELFSIDVGTPRDGELAQVKPFNKPTNGVPSKKARLARAMKLMKMDPCETITVQISRKLMDQIEKTANFYGISPTQHCLSCIGYHAALWRKEQEKRRPKSPFERFELSLAVDSRKSRLAGGQSDPTDGRL